MPEHAVAGELRVVLRREIFGVRIELRDAPNVVGFDPFARLVDYLVRVAGEDSRQAKEAA